MKDNYPIEKIVHDPILSKHYKFILKLVNDSAMNRESAFSIQNFAKIGYAHSKLPGEWYGPSSISVMLRDLNKIFKPLNNFEICLFNEGSIYLDKVQKLGC